MRRFVLLALVIFGLVMLGPGLAAAQSTGELAVVVSPESVTTEVGDPIELEITVRNESADTRGPLAVHIDITDPRAASSTDPEDWTAVLTQSLGDLGPGEGRIARWSIEPISDGNFVLYAVVLEAAEPLGGAIAVSNGVPIEVAERRSLNPQNVLPVVIAIPALLGVAIVFQRRRAAHGDRVDLDNDS